MWRAFVCLNENKNLGEMICVWMCVCVTCTKFPFMKNLPWKSRIRALLHTLTPRFSPECGTSTMFRIRCNNAAGNRFFDGSVEVNANTEPRFSWVFVGQCEHKRCCISNGRTSLSRMNTNAAFWLTKIYHVDGHRKVGMVARWISTEQFGYLWIGGFFVVVVDIFGKATRLTKFHHTVYQSLGQI